MHGEEAGQLVEPERGVGGCWGCEDIWESGGGERHGVRGVARGVGVVVVQREEVLLELERGVELSAISKSTETKV